MRWDRDLDEAVRARAAVLLALTLCIARRSAAQEVRSGDVEGSVADSVHARALAGVQVIAVGTGSRSEVRRVATTDSAGRYRIDSLLAGRYLVGFESALLDSLEVTLTPREATVTPGQVTTLDLAVPSAAKLRSAVCLGATLPPETGVIYGHVVSAETESPLAGVSVAMAWRDLGVDRKTLRPINSERTASVVTDENGWYRMCGVPTGTWVSMQIQHDKRSGPVLRTRVDDTLGITIRHLSLSTGTSRASETTVDSSAGAPLSGSATLTGNVRGPEGAPVPSAEVRVRNSPAVARTDASGDFTLRDLPAGTQDLEVRRVGYAVAEASVELRSGVTTTRDVRLERVVVNLDSVRVVATRTKYPDFSEHRKMALFGTFLGPEDIEKQRVSRTSDIIEKIPGFVVVQKGYRTEVQSPRGMFCRVNIIIDGVIVRSERTEVAVSIDDVHPSEIGAIEAYRPGDPGTPMGYDRGCGAIAIWTKK